MNNLRISLVQSDIVWEQKEENLNNHYQLISSLKGKSDLVIFPELFSTGFSMNVNELAETNTGNTIQTVKNWSTELNAAISGSFLAKDSDNQIYNRSFFVTPEGKSYFSDKRHLFRMGEENNYYIPGKTYSIISYKGWNIRLIVCYDLRFPVWIRNKNNAYDLLICSANWPKARANVWNTLLKARAIENLCYVCGVNRIGEDANGIYHQGDSALIDYKGNVIGETEENQIAVKTFTIEKEKLSDFRTKFPAWKDADDFIISEI